MRLKIISGTLVGALLALVAPAAASAALTPDPASYDWGAIDRYQQSSIQNFTFTNNEGADVSVSGPALDGANASEFAISGQDCGGATLGEGKKCSVSVYVQPQSGGAKAATLEVDDGNGGASVPLSADAQTGTLTVSPDPIAFNPQPWYFGSQFQNVNVQNSNFGTHISTVSITGTDAALFSIAYDNCSGFQVFSFNNCSVGINFNPSAPSGSASANLVITSDSASSPTTTSITANALNGPQPVATPANFDFGPAAVGSSAGPQTFTLANTGDFPLQVEQLLVLTGSPQSFPLTNDDCSQAIVAPAASCTFQIAFSPRSVGVREASVFVIANTPGPVTQVGISGEGLTPPGAAANVLGTPAAGETLSCRPSGVSGELTYSWLRNGEPIAGADAPTYSIPDSDVGARLACRLTAANPLGSATADSAETGPVAPRDLSGLEKSFVGPAFCRVAAVEPIAGVKVAGSAPVTPESPLTFSASRSLKVELGGRTKSGRKVSFVPRELAALADGPQQLSVDGKPGQIVLAPCQLSARVVGSSTGRTTYALSGAIGIESGKLKTSKLRIGSGAGVIGEASVFVQGEPETHFPLSGRRSSYNGIDVRLGRHKVAVSGLPTDSAVVEFEFEEGLVSGKGGNARASAKLAGGAGARATVKTYWN